MTDVSALEAYTGELSEAAAKARTAAQQQYDYTNGNSYQDVQTESGPVPSLAKQARLYQQAIPDAAADLSKTVADGRVFLTVAEAITGDSPVADGKQFWVAQAAPLNGKDLYRRTGSTAVWEGVSQAGSAEVAALRSTILAMSVSRRPLGPLTGTAPLTWSVGNTQMLLSMQQRIPIGPDGRRGTVTTLGDSLMLPVVTERRPLTEGYQDDETVLLSGDSVMLRSGNQTKAAASSASYDSRQIQQQTQAPQPTRQALVSAGQVYAYGPAGRTALTTVGTWLAAHASAFDIVQAIGAKSGEAKAHSILRDGRMVRDGNVLFHKLVTGQSLALGSRGIVLDANGEYTIEGRRGNLITPYVPVDYTGRMLTLPGGPRPTSWVGATAFDPVREYVSGVVGETPAAAYMLSMLGWFDRNTSIAPRMLYSVSAAGGTAYAGLKKGTTVYNNLLAHITAAMSIAAGMGLDYVVPSVSIVHGESQTGTTQAEYLAILIEWTNNLWADIVAKTGQAVGPVFFMSQMLTGEPGTIPAIPLAQLQAHNEVERIIVIGPKYQCEYFDQFHLTAAGYDMLGVLESRAERLTMVSGSKWQPLKVLSHTVSGTTITLKLNNLPGGHAATPGPIGRLAIDTQTVTDPGNYGFQISYGSIKSVALGADGASLVITSSVLVPAGTTLTYALQSDLDKPQFGSGRRGCIRDTDLRDFERNTPVYNWLTAFSLELQP